MGVLFDYFSAADDAAAAEAIDMVGGPGKFQLPMPFARLQAEYGHDGAMEFFKPQVRVSEYGFPSVSAKNFDPVVDLGAIEESLTGVSGDALMAREAEPVAIRDEGECLVLPISDATSAALAAATGPELTTAAQAWAEESALPGSPTPDLEPIVRLLTALGELARGAAERGERLYCWMCL
ncbi:hypothetical protein [Catenulispora subtropica]|uniref:Uncharacterized protein n=1 Tax=Catenulispora subtropica TaxID=450798 RepID=A0ABN2SP05_9ACTN